MDVANFPNTQTDTREVAGQRLKSFIERSVIEILDEMSATEVWKKICDYPNYEISSFGRVKKGERLLAPSINKYGYLTVSLCCNSHCASFRIHRLVAIAFLGRPPFAGALIAHNDGQRTNNVINNLRWASALENQADSVRHNTRVRGSHVRGSKLIETDIPNIRRRIQNGEPYPLIANDYNVSISTICLINKERTWRHVA